MNKNKNINFKKFVSVMKWKSSLVYKMFYFIKDVFWNPVIFLLVLSMLFVYISKILHTTPKKYVGTVREVSLWDGNATLETKTQNGKDTIVIVHHRKGEKFEDGQIITIWTGGDLFDGFGTTQPQH